MKHSEHALLRRCLAALDRRPELGEEGLRGAEQLRRSFTLTFCERELRQAAEAVRDHLPIGESTCDLEALAERLAGILETSERELRAAEVVQ